MEPVRPQNPFPDVQTQILRHPPQATAAIPPLPEEPSEGAINVIQLETKGKEKVKEPEVMPIKRARMSEDSTNPPASMETKEGATSGKKQKSRTST